MTYKGHSLSTPISEAKKTYSKNFRGYVVRRADGHVRLHGAVLAQPQTGAEVRQTDMAVGVQEDVVGLDISVDISQLVDGVDGKNHLRDVEASHLLGQPVLELAEEREEVSAAVVVHHQVLKHQSVNTSPHYCSLLVSGLLEAVIKFLQIISLQIANCSPAESGVLPQQNCLYPVVTRRARMAPTIFYPNQGTIDSSQWELTGTKRRDGEYSDVRQCKVEN